MLLIGAPMRREPTSALSRLASGVVLASVAATVALGGCGSRGPLDDTPLAVDAGVDAESLRAAQTDAGPADGGREASAVVACGSCVLGSCGSTILECVREPACRTVFQCVATTCLGGGSGGGLNPRCLLNCATEAPEGAAGVLELFTCLTGTCGPECGTILGQLGGGLGGAGGLGGGGGGKGPGGIDRDALHDILAPWPELVVSPAPKGNAHGG